MDSLLTPAERGIRLRVRSYMVRAFFIPLWHQPQEGLGLSGRAQGASGAACPQLSSLHITSGKPLK